MAMNVDHVHLFIKNPFRNYKAFTKLLRKVLSKMFHRNASQSTEVFCKLDSEADKGEKQ
jgi:hypothetical protein